MNGEKTSTFREKAQNSYRVAGDNGSFLSAKISMLQMDFRPRRCSHKVKTSSIDQTRLPLTLTALQHPEQSLSSLFLGGFYEHLKGDIWQRADKSESRWKEVEFHTKWILYVNHLPKEDCCCSKLHCSSMLMFTVKWKSYRTPRWAMFGAMQPYLPATHQFRLLLPWNPSGCTEEQFSSPPLKQSITGNPSELTAGLNHTAILVTILQLPKSALEGGDTHHKSRLETLLYRTAVQPYVKYMLVPVLNHGLNTSLWW